MNGSVFPVFSNTEHREKEESNAQTCIYQQKEIGPKKEESAIENTGYSSKKKKKSGSSHSIQKLAHKHFNSSFGETYASSGVYASRNTCDTQIFT